MTSYLFPPISFIAGVKASKHKIFAAMLLTFAGIAIAGVLIGSFSVASAIGYANQTLEADAATDQYPAAVAIYTQYIIPLIAGTNAPSAAALIADRDVVYKKGDYFRLTYADGSKVDFTITPYPVSIPIAFSKKVASDSTPDVTSYQLAQEDIAKANACGRSGSRSFATGYYGTYWPDSGDDSVVDVVGYWVDTGYVTLSWAASGINCP